MLKTLCKFLGAACLLALTANPLWALGKVNLTAEYGGQRVKTGLFVSSTTAMRTFPGATVDVFYAGTLNRPSIYSDTSLTPLGNPFTASTTDASAPFYVQTGAYDIKFTCNYPTCKPDPGNVTWTIPNHFVPDVDARTFGAVCDFDVATLTGTDDTVALQTAIDSTPIGGTLLIPTSGSSSETGCQVTATLIIDKAIRIVGAGPGGAGNGSLSAQISSNFDGNLFLINGAGGNLQGSGISIENLNLHQVSGTNVATSGTGTITITQGSTAVSGAGTAFTSQLTAGKSLIVVGGNASAVVKSITNDTNLVLTLPWNHSTAAGSAFSFVNSRGPALKVTATTAGLRTNWLRLFNVNIEPTGTSAPWTWSVEIDGSSLSGSTARDVWIESGRFLTGGLYVNRGENINVSQQFCGNNVASGTTFHCIIGGTNTLNTLYLNNNTGDLISLDLALNIYVNDGRYNGHVSTNSTSGLRMCAGFFLTAPVIGSASDVQWCTRWIDASATYDPGTVNDNTTATTTIVSNKYANSGAAAGDPCVVSFSTLTAAGILTSCTMTSTTTATITFRNVSGGGWTPGSGTLTARVQKLY